MEWDSKRIILFNPEGITFVSGKVQSQKPGERKGRKKERKKKRDRGRKEEKESKGERKRKANVSTDVVNYPIRQFSLNSKTEIEIY